MIRSMTGYGSAQCVEDGVSYTVEIRSLNHRYYKLSCKLPEHLQAHEYSIDKQLRERISRGSVTFSLRIRSDKDGGARPLNTAALRSYLESLMEAQANQSAKTTIDMATIAMLPGVCEPAEPDDETLKKQYGTVTALAKEAIEKLSSFREEEGRALQKELAGLCDSIRTQLADVEKRAPVVVEEYHEKLKNRVALLMKKGGFELEADGLMREVAIYAERSDISEEVSRLNTHLNQFDKLGQRKEPVGRTLDFLTQEMLREANTIASKSNDSEVAWRVVEIKSLIDRIKEQVQNVE